MTDSISKNLVYKSFTFDIKTSAEQKQDGQQIGVFSGAMASEDLDRGDDIISPNAFDNSLERYRKNNRNIRLFYQHNTFELPIGIIPIESVEKVGKLWNIKGELNLDTQIGKEVYALLRQKALSDLSIGFSIINFERDGEKRIINELELWEVSVVSEPMNPNATIVDVKAGNNFKSYSIEDLENNINSKKDFENILRESGSFSRKAAVYLASHFEAKQSKSVDADKEKENEVLSMFKELNALIKKI